MPDLYHHNFITITNIPLQSTLIPAKHRDQLRVLIVLKGYSSIACGKGMRALDQQNALFEFAHQIGTKKVSHVDLLHKRVSDYANLCNVVTYQKLDNSKTVDVEGLKLRPELIIDYTKPYYAGINIVSSNLKSVNRSRKVLYSIPKTLLVWARLYVTEFCYADAFCSKW